MEGVAPSFRCTVPIMNERFVCAKSMNKAAILIKASASLHTVAKDALAVQITKMNHITPLEHLSVDGDIMGGVLELSAIVDVFFRNIPKLAQTGLPCLLRQRRIGGPQQQQRLAGRPEIVTKEAEKFLCCHKRYLFFLNKINTSRNSRPLRAVRAAP